MFLKDLIGIVYDDVCLYVWDDKEFEHKTLYKGKKENIPFELLQREVKIIGAKCKGLVDIKL